MSQTLSVEAAALEYPGRIALITEDGTTYTFAKLAELARELGPAPAPAAIRAPATVATVIAVYRALEEGRTIGLLSQNSTEEEFAALCARVDAHDASRPSLLLFTSGSSGRAKGVVLSHEALASSARAANQVLGWQENDRWLCCLPLSHIGGLSVLFRALAARRTAVLCERFSTALVANTIANTRSTHISLVPTMLWRLLESGFKAPEHLRVTLMGGAALDGDLASRAADAGFSPRPSYGMTETASMVVCCGHPLPGVQVRIGNAQQIELRAPMLMDGYLPPDASPIAEGWLTTSDRGLLRDDGTLEILGRSDATIISGGENIDLAEVESVLRSHAGVRACLAIGIPDAQWGEKLVALIVREEGAGELNVTGLRGHKRPKSLVYVQKLPLLENGKADRHTARKLAKSGDS